MKKYEVLNEENAASVTEKGTTVFEFLGHDYGCAREDTVAHGTTYVAVSAIEGKGPFFTIPLKDLKPITE